MQNARCSTLFLLDSVACSRPWGKSYFEFYLFFFVQLKEMLLHPKIYLEDNISRAASQSAHHMAVHNYIDDSAIISDW